MQAEQPDREHKATEQRADSAMLLVSADAQCNVYTVARGVTVELPQMRFIEALTMVALATIDGKTRCLYRVFVVVPGGERFFAAFDVWDGQLEPCDVTIPMRHARPE